MVVPDGEAGPLFTLEWAGAKRSCRGVGLCYFGKALHVKAFGWSELVPLYVGQGLAVLGLEQAENLAPGVRCGCPAKLVGNGVADLDCLGGYGGVGHGVSCKVQPAYSMAPGRCQGGRPREHRRGWRTPVLWMARASSYIRYYVANRTRTP